jgi:recombination protein RecA
MKKVGKKIGKKPTKKVGKKASSEAEVLQDIIRKMEKAYGSNSVFVPDEGTILCKVSDWVTTRNFMIDSCIRGGYAIGAPIIPFGRLTEIAGKNKSGKTTLMGHIMAETQARGGIAAIADTEQALDLDYFEMLGVDLSKLIIIPCVTVEDVFEKFETFIDIVREGQNNKQLITLGWDSVGATPTNTELADSSSDKHYAECAKVVSQNLRRVIHKISTEKINLMFNNHVYYKMGVKFGDPLETYGGERIKFLSTIRIRLKAGSIITTSVGDDKVEIGKFVHVQLVKNKMVPHLRTVRVPCIGGYGFHNDYAIMEQAKKLNLITGAAHKKWITPGDEEISFQNWGQYLDKVVVHPDYGSLVDAVVSRYNRKYETLVKRQPKKENE